ncbi:methionyl-tRNA formyltransferase [bacterium]|nr:methionyl-tRNA formyltransferase [bacterium]
MSLRLIVIASSRPWNRNGLKQITLTQEVIEVSTHDEMMQALELEPSIRFIFFLHWSHIVPLRITDNYECVCFHMTDVPYGRGGSPLQNLVARGHQETKLTALRMGQELDAGPVYLKRSLSLNGSTAEEIYMRANALSCEMITQILDEEIEPQEQTGEVVPFVRRTPEQSVLPTSDDLDLIHDHIRMLDAEGYPYAFIEIGDLRLEFTQSSRYNNKVIANVKITRKKTQ